MITSVYIASTMTSWWGFVFWYCVLFPIGIGLVYWPPIMCGWEWFPDNKGTISGVVVAGFGFGAFIFGFISTEIVNPGNSKTTESFTHDGITDKIFDKEIADRVPHMFKICLIFWSLFALIAILGVQRNPAYVKQEQIRIEYQQEQE